MRYRVIRIWEVDAIDNDDAIKKTKNWNHDEVIIKQIKKFKYR